MGKVPSTTKSKPQSAKTHTKLLKWPLRLQNLPFFDKTEPNRSFSWWMGKMVQSESIYVGRNQTKS
jgi:hypothetical protein